MLNATVLKTQARARVRNLLEVGIDWLYPPVCPVCRAETERTGGLCSVCWRGISFIAGGGCFRCGMKVPVARAGEEEEDLICDGCVSRAPLWRRGSAAIEYSGTGRHLVHALKYHGRLELVPMLARWMARRGTTNLRGAEWVVPVPLHWTRRIARGFNQSACLARQLCVLLERESAFLPEALVRARRTAPQFGRAVDARYANVSGAFRVPAGFRTRIADASVLLVDDVVTSGATMNVCAGAMLDAGAAKVNMVTLARVPSPIAGGWRERKGSEEQWRASGSG